MSKELDFGPHRRCSGCGSLHPNRRMIEYGNKFFCSIFCYLEREGKPHDEGTTDLPRIAVLDHGKRK